MNGRTFRPRRAARRGTSAAAALTCTALFACAPARAIDCTIATTGVAFGVYDPLLAGPTDSAGSVTLRCTHTGGGAARAVYTIGLSAGNSGNFVQRELRAGTSILWYNLFDSAARTAVWGNGTAGSVLMRGTLVVNPGKFAINERSHPIYGRIPAQQAVSTGSYSDTVLVTLTF